MEQKSNIQEDRDPKKTQESSSGKKKSENLTQLSEAKEDNISAEEKKIDESLDESFPASDPPAHHNFN